MLDAALSRLIDERVLPAYEGLAGARVAEFGGGLINRTFLVEPNGSYAGARVSKFILQRLNPIFSPRIHANIAAVTERLVVAGLTTPRLLAARDGSFCIDLAGGGGLWRLMTFVEGVSFDVVASAEQARAAAALVGRFHAALAGLAAEHAFAGMRAGVHDTPRHLARLRDTLAAHSTHRLARDVGSLATEILAGAAALPALPSLQDRIGHGDLKFNNVLFAGAGPGDSDRPVCLVDLDTVGPQSFAFELGDAWRSWCNRAGEDSETARLDLDVLDAATGGYREGARRPLDEDERRALLLGPEWVSLELAARFATDALEESYFGWDARRFASRGAHNLARARGQWSLHRAFVASRPRRARSLGL